LEATVILDFPEGRDMQGTPVKEGLRDGGTSSFRLFDASFSLVHFGGSRRLLFKCFFYRRVLSIRCRLDRRLRLFLVADAAYSY